MADTESLYESYRRAWIETAGEDFRKKMARQSLMAVAPEFAHQMQEEDMRAGRIEIGQWAYGSAPIGPKAQPDETERKLVEWNGTNWNEVRGTRWYGLTELTDLVLVTRPLDPHQKQSL